MVPDSSDRARSLLSDAAELALESGLTVEVPDLGLAVVPDLVVVEGWANGVDPGRAGLLARPDGRCVFVYRLPDDEVDITGPRCPRCLQPAPEGSYPPSEADAEWWSCGECLRARVWAACPECCEERRAA